jgi:hypothetical protein
MFNYVNYTYFPTIQLMSNLISLVFIYRINSNHNTFQLLSEDFFKRISNSSTTEEDKC